MGQKKQATAAWSTEISLSVHAPTSGQVFQVIKAAWVKIGFEDPAAKPTGQALDSKIAAHDGEVSLTVPKSKGQYNRSVKNVVGDDLIDLIVWVVDPLPKDPGNLDAGPADGGRNFAVAERTIDAAGVG